MFKRIQSWTNTLARRTFGQHAKRKSSRLSMRGLRMEPLERRELLAVTINQATTQPNVAGSGPVRFAVAFSEPVSDFTAADVSLTGSTTPGTLVTRVFGSGTTYEVTVSGMTGPGTIVAIIPAGVAHDAAGNGNPASTSTDNRIG